MRCPHSCPTFPKTSALTLEEVTLVETVLLGLISVAFSGMSAYNEGANWAPCIHRVANVQKEMRSDCHFQELESGQAIPDLKRRLIEDSKFFVSAPFCPSGGTYVFHEGAVPHVGTPFMRCSLPDHAPKGTSSW